MEYKIVNKKTGRRELIDDYSSKKEAQQAIVNTSRCSKYKKEALKYYLTMTVRSILKLYAGIGSIFWWQG